MVIKSRTIELIWKLNTDVFRELNKSVYSEVPLRLGGSHKLTEEMTINCEEEMKVLLPSAIRMNPDDQRWHNTIGNYFNSWGILIPASGYKMEVGFKYSLVDAKRKEAIALLMKNNENIKTEEDLAMYVETKVPIEQKYLYGTPISIEKFIDYRAALLSSKVANSATDATKSENIEFVLSSIEDLLKVKRSLHSVTLEADAKYLEVIKDSKTVNSMVAILGGNPKTLDESDKQIFLRDIKNGNPTNFLSVANDTTLLVKGTIERYILAGVLNRLSGTSIVVDASDETFVIGKDIQEAVAFFGSEAPESMSRKNAFANRYKSLK